MADFIKRAEADFLEFANQFARAAEKHAAALGIPQSVVSGLDALRGGYNAAYQKCQEPNAGKVDRSDRKEARAKMERAIRNTKNAYIDGNPSGKLTDAIRLEFGLQPVNEGHSPVPQPPTVPELIIIGLKAFARIITVKFRDKGSLRRGKPKGAHGMELRWGFMDELPTDIEKELIHSVFATRSPIKLTFTEGDRGRRICMAGRWEISRGGIKGEFGDVVIAIIP